MFQVAFFITLLMLCGQLTLSKASCCNIADRLDARQSFLVPIPGKACLRVQVYAGGKIQVDPDDPTCTAGNFLSESVADFEGYSGNVATYAEGQLGFKSTVIILEDASLTEVLYDLNSGGEFIEIVIKVPSCSAPTLSPTLAPISAQREILINLYESTIGNNWYSNDDWLSSVNECEWYGVTCNVNGDVVNLNLSGNGLAGTIPDSLGDLSNLEFIDVYYNALTSTIPDSIGNLSNMFHLELADNTLTGVIPDSLGDLSNLEVLFLYRNTLTGTFPDSLGDLSNVKKIGMNGNALTGTIPDSIGNLSNMYYLSLRSNALTGTIPASIGNLGDLDYLYLETNGLTGTIPSEVCELNISYFSYDRDEIEGECD